MSTERVWLVTGANSGFGMEYVKQILARGDKVIATGRSPTKLSALADTGVHLIKLDVTAPFEELQAIAKEAVNVYGRIDVLVNNAGYIEMGTIEETTPERTFQQFNTNVFGLLNVTRAFLPYMRERRSGTIVNTGSLGGWKGYPGIGLYCATKFTVAALSEALQGEVRQFGIEVLCIEPGYFATSLLQPSNLALNKDASISDYNQLNKEMTEMLQKANGNQPGDPVKGVARIIEAVTHEGHAKGKNIPIRLILGTDAYEVTGSTIERLQAEREEWKEWTLDSLRDDLPKNETKLR
jgi:short-subunit dehydrogenase